jgi:Carbohydrate binding module (family 6)
VVQAENYLGFNDTTAGNAGGQLRNDNVDLQVTTDTGGGHNVGWTDTGEWLEFPINVTQAGTYQASVRVASLNGGGMFTLESGGQTLATFAVNATGGWQTWTTLTANLGNLTAGAKTLRVQIQAGNFNLNWVELKLGTPTSSSTGGGSSSSAPNVMLGRFNITKDLLLANFDTKPDVDDILAQAGFGTMLKDSRFANVKYLVVAGTFGQQGGEYIDSSSVMNIAFPGIWVAEAGQSNFTAAMIRRLQTELPAIDTRIFVHVVQHNTAFNEPQTNAGDLALVKGATQYNNIPDGNGNPGFNTSDGSNWGRATSNASVGAIWTAARSLANQKNVPPNLFINQVVKNGGFDFSDTVEHCWIFGFTGLNTTTFFDTFLH